MSAVPLLDSAYLTELDWRKAVVAAERARQEYTAYLHSATDEDEQQGRLWLRLWRAERRRDELYRELQ